MAETNTNTNQKFFLDLSGLTTLWNKIKSTFADKNATEASFTNVNTELTGVKTSITGLGSEIDNLETTVLSFAPKEVENYSKALAAASSLSVGTIIDVKEAESITKEDGSTVVYGSGLYIVESNDPVSVKSLSTSSGSDADSGIEGLNVRVESLEKDVIKSAVITDGTNRLGSYSVADNVLLIAHDDTFDINSDSVKALTHRAVAAKFRNIEGIITGIPKFKIAVVEELPTSNISGSTIYLVKNSVNSTNNLYTEYIYIENATNEWTWEKLGEQTLEIGDFVTQSQLNDAISIALTNYMKTSDVQNYVQEQLLSTKNSILTEVSNTYAKKSDVEELAETVSNIEENLDNYLLSEEAATTYLTKNDAQSTYLSKIDAESKGWMTEPQIITSIKEGNIGNSIAITNEQIEDITK